MFDEVTIARLEWLSLYTGQLDQVSEDMSCGSSFENAISNLAAGLVNMLRPLDEYIRPTMDVDFCGQVLDSLPKAEDFYAKREELEARMASHELR